jgi:hypothetical protein
VHGCKKRWSLNTRQQSILPLDLRRTKFHAKRMKLRVANAKQCCFPWVLFTRRRSRIRMFQGVKYSSPKRRESKLYHNLETSSAATPYVDEASGTKMKRIIRPVNGKWNCKKGNRSKQNGRCYFMHVKYTKPHKVPFVMRANKKPTIRRRRTHSLAHELREAPRFEYPTDCVCP